MNKNDWPDERLLNNLLQYQLKKTRWAYIDILKQRPSEVLFQRCVHLVQSGIEKHQLIAIDILAELGLPEKAFWKKTLMLFFELLGSEKKPVVLQQLLMAIGRGNNELNNKQIQILCSFAKHNNKLINEGLVFALQGIEQPKAVKVMVDLSSNEAAFIRNWATFGLGTQVDSDTTAIRKALWKRVSDTHEETRLEAMVGLAKRKDEGIINIIQQELRQAEYGSLLFDAIKELENKIFLPTLRAQWKAVKQDITVSVAWKQSLKECIDSLRIMES